MRKTSRVLRWTVTGCNAAPVQQLAQNRVEISQESKTPQLMDRLFGPNSPFTPARESIGYELAGIHSSEFENGSELSPVTILGVGKTRGFLPPHPMATIWLASQIPEEKLPFRKIIVMHKMIRPTVEHTGRPARLCITRDGPRRFIDSCTAFDESVWGRKKDNFLYLFLVPKEK